jgi:carnitine O-acetyltransferase
VGGGGVGVGASSASSVVSGGYRRGRGDSQSSRSRDQYSQPLPLIFADPGWDRLNTTIISTSNCGNPSLRQFGFGPTTGEGFGIGYIIKDESLSICVSSKHRQTRRFVDTLESYLLEMRRILRITGRKATMTKSTRAREIDLEGRRPKMHARHKPRGRMITGTDMHRLSINGTMSPTDESLALSEDDDIGGCKCLPLSHVAPRRGVSIFQRGVRR